MEDISEFDGVSNYAEGRGACDSQGLFYFLSPPSPPLIFQRRPFLCTRPCTAKSKPEHCHLKWSPNWPIRPDSAKTRPSQHVIIFCLVLRRHAAFCFLRTCVKSADICPETTLMLTSEHSCLIACHCRLAFKNNFTAVTQFGGLNVKSVGVVNPAMLNYYRRRETL